MKTLLRLQQHYNPPNTVERNYKNVRSFVKIKQFWIEFYELTSIEANSQWIENKSDHLNHEPT